MKVTKDRKGREGIERNGVLLLAECGISRDRLWVYGDHLLDRDEVRELIGHLTAWVETGSLEVKR